MTARKFLYVDEDFGYPVESDPTTDTISLAGLSLGTSGLDMNSNPITEVPAATTSGHPLVYGQASAALAGLTMSGSIAMGNQAITGLAAGSAAGDAVNKAQLDQAVINGGHFKELILHEAQVSNAEGILSAIALTMQSQPVSGDTITITNGTTTRTYGAASGGDVQYAIGVDVATTMANLAAAITGDSSGAWDAAFTTALDSIDATGVVVIYETDSAAAASKIYGTWATPADVEVVNYYGKLDYTYKTLSTLPASSPTNSNFGIHRATPEAGELHFVENNDSIYGWDDDADVWQVMSGTASIPDATSASGGGVKGKVTFDSDYGLTVATGIAKIALAGTNPGLEFRTGGDAGKLGVDADTAAGIVVGAGGVGITLAGTNPGLEFRTGGDAGKLGVLTDGAHGVIVGATGVELELVSADRLTVGGSGLDVVGLPLQFKINGTAVSTNVTANNLSELTGGGATTLHTHAGAGEAQRIENTFLNKVTIGNFKAVCMSDTADKIDLADNATEALTRVIGITRTGGTADPGTSEVVTMGVLAGALSSATVNTPYYLGASGALVTFTNVPRPGQIIRVGYAINASDLFVEIQDYGYRRTA